MKFGSRPDRFSIECEIAKFYERESFRALGFFQIHIQGIQYGCRAPDASMLACTYDSVIERLENRGAHIADFARSFSGSDIARAVVWARYGAEDEKRIWGFSQDELGAILCEKKLIWAPDGDQAFDDGGFVLHIDLVDQVRLIGFNWPGSQAVSRVSAITDLTIEADVFYSTLWAWVEWFDRERERADTRV